MAKESTDDGIRFLDPLWVSTTVKRAGEYATEGVAVTSAIFHGFTYEGEIELDVFYGKKKHISKKKFLETVVARINEMCPGLYGMKNIRLSLKNTRIQVLSGQYLKAFVKVRG
ncbi:MAG: hypothetical protein UY40_C0026G0008 [candidate division CPR1 bacterium GW2011_GWC1_49_13]|uniref:Uncharacterized protein n=1 Tax=candidate division CPR1 bacterium GW2011_GWC1_49_13 TaxID=1618342 RepID=A0A0G1VG30_9BACT|nr:MAG: hypothetical protein UY40_C0026G0008 [candidate division CPR1 bacterium GW2011_GWC1_49_13]